MIHDLKQFSAGDISARDIMQRHGISGWEELSRIMEENELSMPTLSDDERQNIETAFTSFLIRKITK